MFSNVHVLRKGGLEAAFSYIIIVFSGRGAGNGYTLKEKSLGAEGA